MGGGVGSTQTTKLNPLQPRANGDSDAGGLKANSCQFEIRHAYDLGLDLNGQVASSTPDQDLDGDDIPLLGEFGFALDPNQFDSELASEVAPGKPFIQFTEADGERFVDISFTRRISSPWLRYVIGISHDLISWDQTEILITQISADPTADGITEFATMRYNVPVSTPERIFLNIGVELLRYP